MHSNFLLSCDIRSGIITNNIKSGALLTIESKTILIWTIHWDDYWDSTYEHHDCNSWYDKVTCIALYGRTIKKPQTTSKDADSSVVIGRTLLTDHLLICVNPPSSKSILKLTYCEYEWFCNVCGLSIFCLVMKRGICCCFSSWYCLIYCIRRWASYWDLLSGV